MIKFLLIIFIIAIFNIKTIISKTNYIDIINSNSNSNSNNNNIINNKYHNCEIYNNKNECIKLKKLNLYRIFLKQELSKELLELFEEQIEIDDYDHQIQFDDVQEFNVYLNDLQFNLLDEKKDQFNFEIKKILPKNVDLIKSNSIISNINNNNNNNINNNNNFHNNFHKITIDIDNLLNVKLSESGLLNYNKYLNYQELHQFLIKISNRYPNITKLYSIGRSANGRELFAIEITTKSGNKFKPSIKLVGNMHGDEVVGRQMLVYLIDYLCSKYYQKNSEVVEILENIELSIIPSMNPDGYELGQRENANNFDLNRNFPDKYVGYSSELYKVIQPEVQSIIDWCKKKNFIMSANLHGGSLVANYPYDSTRDLPNGYGFGIQFPSPDDIVFRKMALTYSLNHREMSKSSEFLGGIVNGAKWYTLRGGMQDWNYDFTNNMEITLELSYDKIPNSNQLNKYWEDNKKALLKFISLPLRLGVYGRITNEKNETIFAEIKVARNERTITNDPTNGYYTRLLDDGFYNITASSNGYKSETKFILLNANTRTHLDFILKKE